MRKQKEKRNGKGAKTRPVMARSQRGDIEKVAHRTKKVAQIYQCTQINT